MIIPGDSLDELRKMDADSVDVIITDPPYGYSFMGKDWDKAVPSVEIWQECLRVLKLGAFMCVMSAPRSDVQNAMISRLLEAGFRLDFTPIYWTYASGFPKAGNIGKLVDKRLGAEREVVDRVRSDGKKPGYDGNVFAGNVSKTQSSQAITDQAKTLDGSYAGFQPKPAVEVIIVAMKPLSEKTYVDQALDNGHGVSWLDDGRIPTGSDTGMLTRKPSKLKKDAISYVRQDEPLFGGTENPQGRFPANLLVSDDVLNDGRVIKSTVRKTDKQSDGLFGKFGNSTDFGCDSGSYSHYFDLDKWAKTLPFLIVPKASKSEKNAGLENFEEKAKSPDYRNPTGNAMVDRIHGLTLKKNHHPTVKPLKLMSYLITLFSRPGDTVLDPFVGSGTTVVAAKLLGREGIGIEREAEYAEIARARLAHITPQLPPERPEPGVPPVTVDDLTKQVSLF